jgi:outer membrane protein assembly factor BamB
MTSAFAVSLVLVLFAPAPETPTDGWPQFRGPTGQGIVSAGKVPTDWGPDRNVAWKQEIPGTGWSSPVVHDGRIYLTAAVPVAGGAASDLSLRTLCVSAKNGKILWDVEALKEDGSKAPKPHSKNSHASPTPVIDAKEKRLYVHFGHMGTACLDLDGKVLWTQTDLTYAPVHGNGGSPILADGLLVFSIDGSDKQCVVALDAANGKVKWQTDRHSKATKKFSFSTPLVIEVDGKKQVISPASDVVCAYDLKSGDEIWRVTYEGYSLIPRPVYAHGLVYTCTGFEAPQLLAIKADGKGDVTKTHVAWSIRKNVPLTPSLLVSGDELYMVSDHGMASCLDAKTGEAHWQERLGGNFSASPILADDKVYFLSEEGVGHVVKAAKKFERIAKNDLKERTLASYAVAEGALFIRTETHLYRIEKP